MAANGKEIFGRFNAADEKKEIKNEKRFENKAAEQWMNGRFGRGAYDLWLSRVLEEQKKR